MIQSKQILKKLFIICIAFCCLRTFEGVDFEHPSITKIFGPPKPNYEIGYEIQNVSEIVEHGLYCIKSFYGKIFKPNIENNAILNQVNSCQEYSSFRFLNIEDGMANISLPDKSKYFKFMENNYSVKLSDPSDSTRQKWLITNANGGFVFRTAFMSQRFFDSIG